jgi:hypothetical protein
MAIHVSAEELCASATLGFRRQAFDLLSAKTAPFAVLRLLCRLMSLWSS